MEEPRGRAALHCVQDLIGILYSFNFFLLLVCAVAYYKLAELDPDASSILWAGL